MPLRHHGPHAAEAWRVRHVQPQVPSDLRAAGVVRGGKAQSRENGGPERRGATRGAPRIRDSFLDFVGFYGVLLGLWDFMLFLDGFMG